MQKRSSGCASDPVLTCDKTYTQLAGRLTQRTPFVLLETTRRDSDNFRSFFFDRPAEILCLRPGQSVQDFFGDIERALQEGLWAVGYFAYELGYLFEEKLAALAARAAPSTPLAWVGIFQTPAVTGEADGSTDDLFGSKDPPPEEDLGPRVADLRLSVTRDEYCRAISRIKSYIEAGDTYQVNYTVKYKFSCKEHPVSLYRALRDRQRVSYAALLCDGEHTVLSLSPELFFRRDGLRVQSKPMKGTAPRGRTTGEDKNLAHWLSHDPKNRAENLMIVDLIRNDLGRLAPPGKVCVPRLFEVEPYQTLFQMTSTVEAELSPGTPWEEIFRSLFPCGSVTGAPKIRTMEIIAELEKEPRGVYTGAIGYISPQGQACFNVAIRTVVLDASGQAEMGIGSGVVYDSDPSAEYDECLLKARFLTEQMPTFALIESILLEGGDLFILDAHLKRLEDSAAYFGFVCPIADISKSLLDIAEDNPSGRFKVRLLLHSHGAFEIEHAPIPEPPDVVSFRVSDQRVSSRDPFLYHKTTHRPLYTQQAQQAQADGLDEVVFLNERDELTEGTRFNLFVQQSGQLYTPPLFAGLLPGTLRQTMLDQSKCTERILTLDDLKAADKLFLGNSVRGLVEAVWGKGKSGA